MMAESLGKKLEELTYDDLYIRNELNCEAKCKCRNDLMRYLSDEYSLSFCESDDVMALMNFVQLMWFS